jgi:molecular chaperone HtpG
MANVKFGLRLLETLTSALYDNPIVLFREYVQNSVDAYKTALSKNFKPIDDFVVNIDIDKDKRLITVFDNGYGIPGEIFQSKMTDIGVDTKSALSDQIGFRGIGRLSAIPFCEKLVFKNKPEGNKNIYVFTWNGKEFNDMLIKDSTVELSKAFDVITMSSTEKYKGNINDHFFHVFIENYNDEIDELIQEKDKKQKSFKQQLSEMLPLNYSPDLSFQNEIKEYYRKIMNEELDNLSYNILLNSEPLYKQYTNKNKLESGIWFWDLKFSKIPDGLEEPFGILWFTFDRKIVANPNDEPFGILVRSKNILMGNNNSLTDAIFRNKPDDYIASHRELTQTLQGVYGEMLINSTRFKDNARRDWFKLDSRSIVLRNIIFEFLKRLYIYRTTASKAFSEKKAENTEKNKQKLRDAFIDLTSAPDSKTFVDSFYKAKVKADHKKEEQKKEKEENVEKNKLEYADEDVPFLSFPLQRLYNKILILLRDFFSQDGNLEKFLKVRVFIKKGLNKEE